MHIVIIRQGPIPLIRLSSIFSSYTGFVDGRERLTCVAEGVGGGGAVDGVGGKTEKRKSRE